jgi:hypothetical protein
LSFDEERASRKENLKTIYKISQAPGDSGLRQILDDVNWEEFDGIFNGILNQVKSAGILKSYEYYQDYNIVSIDGVHYYSSEEICCDQCLEIRKSNGKKDYRHSLLSSVLVHPEKKEVLPLLHEPIIKQDGELKNDCERNASKRLLPKLSKSLEGEKVIIVEDALGSNGPHIRLIKESGFNYVIGVKPDGNKYLFDLVERLDNQGKIHYYEQEKGSLVHQFRYANNLPLNSENRDIKTNFLDYKQIDRSEKKADRHFSWATDIKLSKTNVYRIMRIGRSRWKIENETFNTLKNQGYNFEHNFGHGKKNLSVVFSMLMMLAFLVDQLQQGWNMYFKNAWEETRTKKSLWEKVRQKFNEFDLDSMEVIYRLISGTAHIRYKVIIPEDSG